MDYGRTVTTQLDFEDAVAQTRAALAEQGFGVLTEIDVQATLKKKLDPDMEPYLILGACNPQLAHQALEVERDIGLLLPCNVVVRDGDRTMVQVLDLQVMVSLPDRPELQPVADDAGRRRRPAAEDGFGGVGRRMKGRSFDRKPARTCAADPRRRRAIAWGMQRGDGRGRAGATAGAVPLAAGAGDVCLLGPLVHGPLRGRAFCEQRALRRRTGRL